MMRQYSILDKFCIKADKALKFLSGNLSSAENFRQNPAHAIINTTENFTQAEIKKITGFMRVNYTGEVCAQALYQGQAITTKNINLKKQLEKAGLEEQDHLYWCQSRLNDFNAPVSILNPLFYTGSLCLGMAAGLLGDEWNLGFLQETENQVVQHLEYHLEHLPIHDTKTRVILETMREEEQSHADTAEQAGAKSLPIPIKFLMRFTAKLMTKTTYWI